MKDYFIDEWIGTQGRVNDIYEVTIIFRKYGFFSMGVGHIEFKGNWRYEAHDFILTLFPPDQKFKIQIVTNNHFIMSRLNVGDSFIFYRKNPKLGWLDERDDLLS